MSFDLCQFLLIPWIAGIGLSLITSSMGCILVWRRLSFFGDALAHSTLLGVFLSLILNVSLFWGVFSICLLMGLILGHFSKQTRIGSDTWLAILSYSALALGVILISKTTPKVIDPASYLFGDILIVSSIDLINIFGTAFIIIIFLICRWQPLLLITLNADLAQAEGINVKTLHYQLTVILALSIASCLKCLGALLVPALLVIPPAAAASFSKTPLSMIGVSFFIALISITLGLFLSVAFNTPSGAMIVMTSLGLFIIIKGIKALKI